MADGKGSLRLRAYREAYRSLAEEVGVRLASEDNPSKAFPPSVKGEILGLIYDGEAWKWEIPSDKLDRMLVLLGTGIRQRYLTNGEAMTLSGKRWCLITHLVDDG